jgi:Protein of unknown function (DUF2924)
MRGTDPEALTRELKKIESLSLTDLRRGYRKHLRSDPPDCFGHDLLRRAIAHSIEERAHKATLPRDLDRALARLAKNEKTGSAPAKVGTVMTMRPGTELVRVWQGSTYKVLVIADGFSWNGNSWKSLSEIAREITGTRWNGPRFFGLRGGRPA